MNRRYVAVLIVLFLGLALAFATVTVLAQGGTPAIHWWVIAAGGGPSSGTGVAINDTLGQPIIGLSSSSGDVALGAGYWYATAFGAEPGSGYVSYFPIILKDSR